VISHQPASTLTRVIGETRGKYHLARMPEVALLLTKIDPPRLRSGHVPRAELVDQLREGLHRRLTLIEAPAGAGKTTLLVEWRAAEGDVMPFAWLSLDPGDNDPVRFWTYVAAAFRHAGVEVPRSVDSAFAAPGVSATDLGLPELLNALAATRDGVVLVLDDYHAINDPEIHAGVTFFLERSPPGVHLAIASRAAPPIGVARLRGRGELGEVPEEELRFDRAGVGMLLNDGLGLGLGDGELDTLLARTEGWAAGLYLAGLSLRSRGGGADFVASFSGELPNLADYLLEEVLSGQSEELRRFLVDTSILTRLTAPLCDAVLETSGSHERLDEIERSNMFLVPLDTRRQWFRYHGLFQDLLRRELARDRDDASIAELHRRAAGWLAENGEVEEAIRHHLASDDEQAASDVIARNWNGFLQRGEVVSASAWLDQLRAELVLGSPQLCLARSWLALDVGDHTLSRRWLDAAELASVDGPMPFYEGGTTVASGIAMLAYQVGDLETAGENADLAVDLEGDSGSPWRAVALTTLGCARYWQGDSIGAEEALVAAVQTARTGTNNLAVLRAMSMLAVAAADSGSIADAERWITAGTELTESENLAEYWMGALVRAAAGRLAERAGDLPAARDHLERAVVLARRGVARPELIYSLHALAPIRASTGDAEGARTALHEASQTLAACPSPASLTHLVSDADLRLRGKAAGTGTTAADDLSARELDVLRLLPSEMSLREIGSALYVSHNTVKTHAARIYRKLGADTRAEAIARARELRLL
jgi:LuxR family transcriptional regulator, maltose regulon positive regulatory protein